MEERLREWLSADEVLCGLRGLAGIESDPKDASQPVGVSAALAHLPKARERRIWPYWSIQ